MQKLTLQTFAEGLWHDAMDLFFVDTGQGFEGPCRIGYRSAYVYANPDAFESTFEHAVSTRLPVDFEPLALPLWQRPARSHFPASGHCLEKS